MTEQPTPTPQPTADQLLNMVIQTLFDIPENSQIQVPLESIVKRINVLKSGFVPPEIMNRNHQALALLDNILDIVFKGHAKSVSVTTILQHLQQCPKYSVVPYSMTDDLNGERLDDEGCVNESSDQ